MRLQPVLYSGTNSKDQFLILPGSADGVVGLGRKFTTDPSEAIVYAYDIARKFSAEMAVIELLSWGPGNFIPVSHQGSKGFDLCDSIYYRLAPGATTAHDPQSLEQRTVKVYSQADMEDFIRTRTIDVELGLRYLKAYQARLTPSRGAPSSHGSS